MSLLHRKSILHIVRYTLIGIAVGAVLPIVSYFLHAANDSGSNSLFDLAGRYPSFAVSLFAPLLTGILGFMFSFRFQSTLGKAEKIIRNQRHLRRLYDNQWLYVIAIEPEEQIAYRYVPKEGWQAVKPNCSSRAQRLV